MAEGGRGGGAQEMGATAKKRATEKEEDGDARQKGQDGSDDEQEGAYACCIANILCRYLFVCNPDADLGFVVRCDLGSATINEM